MKKTLQKQLQILLLPLILLSLIIMTYYSSRDIATLRRLQATTTIASHDKIATAMIHELQKERGYSAGYISSKGRKFHQERLTQITMTNEIREQMLPIIESYLQNGSENTTRKLLESVHKELQEIDKHRLTVTNFETTVTETVEPYTRIINHIISLIEEGATTGGRLHQYMDAQQFLSITKMKEFAGLERAMGAVGFSQDHFPLEILIQFVNHGQRQKAQMTTLENAHEPFFGQVHSEILELEINSPVKQFREQALVHLEGKLPENPDPAEWFRVSTERINALRNIEIKLLEHYIEDINEEYANALQKLLLIMLSVFLTIFIFSTVVIRLLTRFSKSLSQQITVLDQLAQYNEHSPTTFDSFCAESDMLSNTIEEFQKQQQIQRKMEIEQQRFQENEKASRERETHLQKETAERLQNEAQGHLEGVVDISLKTNNAMTDISSLSLNLKEVASGTQTISSAVTELSATIQEINESSREVASRSNEMLSVVDQGNSSASEAITSMNSIETSVISSKEKVNELVKLTDSINDMIDSIDEISAQTHLLALNATIESARAGEHGKGFAVVANEVKSLATQTATFTEEVRLQITQLTDGMQETVNSMNTSGEAVSDGLERIDNLQKSVTEIYSSASQVTELTSAISDYLEQQHKAVNNISEETEVISLEVNNTTASLSKVLDSLDLAISSVEDRIGVFASLGTDRSIIELAKNDHSKFKKRILGTLLGRDSWHSSEVPDHHHCHLGKWYYSVHNLDIKRHPQFKELERYHEAVHELTKQILDAYDCVDFKQADSLMKELDTISDSVIDALSRISRSLK